VGQFVDALKTSIINSIAFKGLWWTVKMVALFFRITYGCCSVHLMLLRQIPAQVMAVKPLIMFEIFHVAQQVQAISVAVHAGDVKAFSLVPFPDRCFMVSTVMHARHIC
jgi:hypothetical protein